MPRDTSILSAKLVNGAFKVNLGPRIYILERSADLESLWDAMGEDDFDDERIPYWTELWPSSLVLAEWIALNASEVAGRLCLDLGCGLGLAALVGADAGGEIAATDYELDALAHCRRNARLNGTPGFLAIQSDWRRHPFRENSFDIIWAGDILYERRAIRPVTDFLRLCLKPYGVAWIADPGRDACREFREGLADAGFCSREAFSRKVASPYSDNADIAATVWEARKNDVARVAP